MRHGLVFCPRYGSRRLCISVPVPPVPRFLFKVFVVKTLRFVLVFVRGLKTFLRFVHDPTRDDFYGSFVVRLVSVLGENYVVEMARTRKTLVDVLHPSGSSSKTGRVLRSSSTSLLRRPFSVEDFSRFTPHLLGRRLRLGVRGPLPLGQ